MKKLLFFSAIVLTCVCVQAQIEDVSVYDDCSKNGYTKVIGYNAPAGVEMVDLGLSVWWANMNVGATSPEEYGDYYAWGETSPKNDYKWSTYKYCNGNNTTITKYCVDSKYGIVDNKTTLEAEDDAANVNWGGNWRMPTHAELKELWDNCSYESTTNYQGTGIAGITFSSKKAGYTDKSIFVPAAGYRDSTYLKGISIYEYYGFWSSTLYKTVSIYAWFLHFHNIWGYLTDDGNRSHGRSVRAVCQRTVITINASHCDSVNVINCPSGQQLRIFAETSLEGSHFVKWSDGNTNNPRIITATQDSSFTAIFEKTIVQETVKCTVVNESPYGTVKVTSNVVKDSTISLEAVEPECSKFVKWSDNNTSNPRNLTVTQDSTLTAIFEKIQFNVSINTSDSIKGKVKME